MAKIIVSVIYSSGAGGNALPEAFTLGGRTFRVSEVLDGWLGADHAYIKLVVSDGAPFIFSATT